MKTAMQELFDRLEFVFQKELLYEYEWWNELKQKELEKEKEQIIDAMERTAMYVSVASIDKEIGKMTIEDLYNQTYKQNK